MYLLSHSFFQLISQSVTKPVRLKFLCFEWFVDPSLFMIYFSLDLWKLFGALNLRVYSFLVVLWFVMVPFCLAVFLWVVFLSYFLCVKHDIQTEWLLCWESGTVVSESQERKFYFRLRVSPRKKDPSGVKTTVSPFLQGPMQPRCSTEYGCWTSLNHGLPFPGGPMLVYQVGRPKVWDNEQIIPTVGVNQPPRKLTWQCSDGHVFFVEGTHDLGLWALWNLVIQSNGHYHGLDAALVGLLLELKINIGDNWGIWYT